MATSGDREKIIRTAWAERGKTEWNPETHGRGLLSLFIPANTDMMPVQPGAPIPPADELEFKLVPANTNGLPVDSIVCEGVVVETVLDLVPPTPVPSPAAWMNNSFEAADQVVRMHVERQRRHIAATSSQLTFVPPQATALKAPQTPNTLTLTFADGEAVKGWLGKQTDEVAAVFSTRAALRVLPTLPHYIRLADAALESTGSSSLRIFRAAQTALAVTAYLGYRSLLSDAAERASRFSMDDVTNPGRASAYASAAAYEAGSSSGNAHALGSTVIDYALDAAGSLGREAFESLLRALANDASLLAQGYSPVTLANSKFWPGPIPDSIRESWESLRGFLLTAEDESWEVWTTWYEERLNGRTANQDIEVAIATLDDGKWKQGPKTVNAYIKDLLEPRNEFETAAEDRTAPPFTAIPQQALTATRFAVNADGLLDVLPDPPKADTAQDELYREVRHKALTLSQLGHNHLADVSEPIARFLAAAPAQIASVSVSRLWSRGNTLRRRLKAHDASVESADPGDPAVLPRLVAEMLRDLVDTYNIFIVGDPEGRELDQVRLGPQERDSSQAIIHAAAQIVEAVKASEGVATPAAIETLSEQTEAARTAPPSVDGDQAIDLSRKTAGNFVIELLRAAYAGVRATAGDLRSGAIREVGKQAAAAASPLVVSFVAYYAHAIKIFVSMLSTILPLSRS